MSVQPPPVTTGQNETEPVRPDSYQPSDLSPNPAGRGKMLMGAALTGTGKFDDAIKTLWENGYDEGTPLVLLVPATGKQFCAYIHESAARAPYASFSTKGMQATHLQSTLGHTVPIIANSHLQSDEFMLLNLDLITVRFVDTMLAYDLPLGEAGTDAAKRRFISEFSLEMHNADKAHWYQTGVTYTRPS